MTAKTPDWHATPTLLAAYARGGAEVAETWSLEAHLIGCALCRAQLTAHLDQTDARVLAAQREELLATLPGRPEGYRLPAVWWLRWVLRPWPLVAVVLAGVAVTVLDLVTSGGATDGSLVWLLAPAIPVAGVALVSVSEDDPCREAVIAAPAALLRLTLWRTLALHAVAMPLVAVLGMVPVMASDGGAWSAAWLLPSLALTATALAIGAVIGVERAARAVALLWCVVALAPALARTGGDMIASLDTAGGSPAEPPLLLSGTAQVVWAAVGVVAVAALVVSRSRFERLTTRMKGTL